MEYPDYGDWEGSETKKLKLKLQRRATKQQAGSSVTI
jgi:hypothetical protein